MTREQQEKLLNDFLHQLVVYKSIKIQKPICSNTIAQCVIDYLENKNEKSNNNIYYKFIGNPNDYGGGYIVGNSYNQYDQKDKFSSTVEEMSIMYPEDWELITSK